jgi:N-carbamoylputrescine amidase
VFATNHLKLGVAICYDRHFDGVMRSLALGGAQLVLCPAVSFGDKSERMWQPEFETDAMRHRIFIAGSNRFGVESPWTVPYYGRGHVVGPNGRIANLSDHNELVISDIDLEELDGRDPSGWDIERDRRGDIYTA